VSAFGTSGAKANAIHDFHRPSGEPRGEAVRGGATVQAEGALNFLPDDDFQPIGHVAWIVPLVLEHPERNLRIGPVALDVTLRIAGIHAEMIDELVKQRARVLACRGIHSEVTEKDARSLKRANQYQHRPILGVEPADNREALG
jgi:hypothetical protein